MFMGQQTYGQKFGYIDTEFITSKMPEYLKVQTVLTDKTKAWLREVSDKQAVVAQMEKEYHLEELLLTEELRQQKLAAIKAKDLEIKAYQEKIFGDEGELFKAKQNAMKPILDEISKALERVVRQKRLDFVFDKANDGLALIYTNPIHDYSDYVIEELGLELDPNLKK